MSQPRIYQCNIFGEEEDLTEDYFRPIRKSEGVNDFEKAVLNLLRRYGEEAGVDDLSELASSEVEIDSSDVVVEMHDILFKDMIKCLFSTRATEKSRIDAYNWLFDSFNPLHYLYMNMSEKPCEMDLAERLFTFSMCCELHGASTYDVRSHILEYIDRRSHFKRFEAIFSVGRGAQKGLGLSHV